MRDMATTHIYMVSWFTVLHIVSLLERFLFALSQSNGTKLMARSGALSSLVTKRFRSSEHLLAFSSLRCSLDFEQIGLTKINLLV